MQYFFQQDFISTVSNLLKKKSYKDVEKALIEDVFKIPKERLFTNCAANRLNPSAKNPIVKMRIASNKGKSSSYRLYFFVIIADKKIYFGHIYPKTGTKGQEALSAKEENIVIKSLLKDVKSNTLEEVFLNTKKQKICYSFSKKEVW